MVVVLAIEKLQLHNCNCLVTFRKSISTELNVSKNVIANRLEFNIGGKFRKKLWCCRRQWEYYALTKGQCSKRQRLYRDQFTSSTKLIKPNYLELFIHGQALAYNFKLKIKY